MATAKRPRRGRMRIVEQRVCHRNQTSVAESKCESPTTRRRSPCGAATRRPAAGLRPVETRLLPPLGEDLVILCGPRSSPRRGAVGRPGPMRGDPGAMAGKAASMRRPCRSHDVATHQSVLEDELRPTAAKLDRKFPKA